MHTQTGASSQFNKGQKREKGSLLWFTYSRIFHVNVIFIWVQTG